MAKEFLIGIRQSGNRQTIALSAAPNIHAVYREIERGKMPDSLAVLALIGCAAYSYSIKPDQIKIDAELKEAIDN